MLGIWRGDETQDNSWLLSPSASSVPGDVVRANEGCDGIVLNVRYWGKNLFVWCAQSMITELVTNFIFNFVCPFCCLKKSEIIGQSCLCSMFNTSCVISLRCICIHVKTLIRARQNELDLKAMKASRTKKSIRDKYLGDSCLRDPCSCCFVGFHSQWDAWTEVMVK